MPSQKIAEIAIAKQTGFGVPATLAAFRSRMTGGWIQPVPDVQTLAETGRNRLDRTAIKLTIGADGNPEFAAREDLAGLLLWGALGTKSVVPTTVAVTSSSVANPSVITSGAAHGLVSGVTATIAGHAGSTPSINGTHVVTVLSPTTFSIPVNVSVGGTGGTVTTLAAHTITPANATPYFTVWAMLGDLRWEKYEDCKIAQYELVSEAASQVGLRQTATLVGTKPRALSQAVYNTEVAVPYTDTPPFVHHHASGLLLVEGVVVASTERVALTIANNTSRQFGDSIFADDVTEGAQAITVATRQRVANAELWNRMIYGSATPASGTLPTSDVLELGAGGLDLMWRRLVAPERSIRIQTGSRVQVASIGAFAPGTGNDPLKMEPTYSIFDPDSGAALTAIVINGIAVY